MSEKAPRHEITLRRVLFELPGSDAVRVRRDVVFKPDGMEALTMDIYSPPGADRGGRVPAVVFVIGYSDAGARKMLGCRFKEMASYDSWARLVAASGLAAITYTTSADPAADVRELLEYLRREAVSLNIDEGRIGVWSCSGHVPTALSLLMGKNQGFVKCAVLCYGYTLDLDGGTEVAEAAATFKFANPGSGRPFGELSSGVPLFVVRAGRDETPGLNAALVRFVAAALGRNLELTVVNHSEAPHAFDLFDGGPTTRRVIGQILAFLGDQLRAE